MAISLVPVFSSSPKSITLGPTTSVACGRLMSFSFVPFTRIIAVVLPISFLPAGMAANYCLDDVLGSLRRIPASVTVLVRQQVLKTAIDLFSQCRVVSERFQLCKSFNGKSCSLQAPSSTPSIERSGVCFQVPVGCGSFVVSQSRQQFASIRNVLLPLQGDCGNSVVAHEIWIAPFTDPIIEIGKGFPERRDDRGPFFCIERFTG